MTGPAVSDFSVPAVTKVRVVDDALVGTVRCGRDGWPRQHRMYDAYQAARASLSTDGRLPLKQGGPLSIVGPVRDFAELWDATPTARTREAVAFTRAFGPLQWEGLNRLRSRRRARGGGEARSVSGAFLAGRIVDEIAWRLPLRQFWAEQRRFRVVLTLGIAAAQREELIGAERLHEALSVLPELRAALAPSAATDPMAAALWPSAPPPITDAEIVSALLPAQSSASSVPTDLRLGARCAHVIAGIVAERTQPAILMYEPSRGFAWRRPVASVLDLLYLLLGQALSTSAFDFCRDCGRVYIRARPDKNTCSDPCAKRFGKRESARKRRALERKERERKAREREERNRKARNRRAGQGSFGKSSGGVTLRRAARLHSGRSRGHK